MTWVGASIMAAGAVGAAGMNYMGAREQAGAARDAASLEAGATESAAQLQYDLGMRSLDIERPFYKAAEGMLPAATSAGLQAYSLLPRMISEATDARSSPFTLNQISGTTEAINRALSAKGLLNSGAGLQAISGATSNILGNAANTQWGKMVGAFNAGAGVGNAGLETGANAARSGAGSLSNLGQGLASTYMTGAGAQSQERMSEGQSMANMYQNIGGLGAGLAQGYMKNKTMQDFLDQQRWNNPFGSWNTPGYSDIYNKGTLAAYGGGVFE